MRELTCSICGKSGRLTRGWCGKHYQRWQAHGDPLYAARDKRTKNMNQADMRAWFLSKLKPTKSPKGIKGKCLLWTKGGNQRGYGQTTVDGKKQQAHRYAWFIEYGYYPKKPYQVNHHCDVRTCCNPKHLYVGTHEDNTADIVNRDRCSHWLTVREVRVIKYMLKLGLTRKRLAEMYGVTTSSIGRIARGETFPKVKTPKRLQARVRIP